MFLNLFCWGFWKISLISIYRGTIKYGCFWTILVQKILRRIKSPLVSSRVIPVLYRASPETGKSMASPYFPLKYHWCRRSNPLILVARSPRQWAAPKSQLPPSRLERSHWCAEKRYANAPSPAAFGAGKSPQGCGAFHRLPGQSPRSKRN